MTALPGLLGPYLGGEPAQLPEGLTPAALLWVSDYVDALLAEGRRRERAAYLRGRDDGREEGRRELEAEDAERYRLMGERYRALMRVPAYARMEHRRYGRTGRPGWIIRRPGEAPPEGAQLEPGAGQWPRDLRRRARLAAEPDPFHLEWGPAMTCTACAYHGLPCPGDDPDEEAADDAAGYG